MEGTPYFLLETAGHCFLCLQPNGRKNHEEGPDSETNCEEEGSISSMQSLCHYLKLNLREILAEKMALSVPSCSLAILEESELKGSLCLKCGQLSKRFTKYFRKFELIKMKLRSCLKSIYDRMAEVEGDDGRDGPVLERYKLAMLKRPEALQQYGIVEQLRKRTLEKCSRKLMGAEPTKMDVLDDPEPTITPIGIIKTESVVLDSGGASVGPSSQETIYFNDVSEPQNFISGEDELEGFSDPLLDGVDNEGQVELSEIKICPVEGSDHLTQLDIAQGDATVDDVEGEGMMDVDIHNDPGVDPLEEPESPMSGKTQTGRIITCSLCQKRFTHPSGLSSHLKAVHLKLREHKCNLCRKQFTQKGALQRHQRGVHFSNLLRSTGKIKLDAKPLSIVNPTNGSDKCSICSAEFKTSRQFQTHYKKRHQDQQAMYECTACANQFKDRVANDLHHRECTSNSRFRCQKCNKTFRTKATLLQHHRKKNMCGTG